MDSLAGTFIAGGFSVDLAHHVMHALGHRIWGFSPEAFDDPDASPLPPDPVEQERMLRQMAEAYPHIVAIALDASDGDPSAIGQSCNEQFAFEFTLDLLLFACHLVLVAALIRRSGRARGLVPALVAIAGTARPARESYRRWLGCVAA